MTPFDIIKKISEGIGEFSEDEINSYYNAWLTASFFSNFTDTIHVTNVLNTAKGDVSNKLNYLFFKNVIPHRKRFGKIEKKHYIKEVKTLSEYFNVSLKRANELFYILKKEDIEEIKHKMKHKMKQRSN